MKALSAIAFLLITPLTSRGAVTIDVTGGESTIVGTAQFTDASGKTTNDQAGGITLLPTCCSNDFAFSDSGGTSTGGVDGFADAFVDVNLTINESANGQRLIVSLDLSGFAFAEVTELDARGSASIMASSFVPMTISSTVQPLFYRAVLSEYNVFGFSTTFPDSQYQSFLPLGDYSLDYLIDVGASASNYFPLDELFAELNYTLEVVSANSLCDNVDQLVAEIVAGNHDTIFDVTRNGLVDSSDLQIWLEVAGIMNSDNVFLPGDANLDGFVDISDFNIWNEHKFTATPEFCSGDFNADGNVDITDFNIWNENKFIQFASVPEPTSGSSIVVLLLLCYIRRRDQE